MGDKDYSRKEFLKKISIVAIGSAGVGLTSVGSLLAQRKTSLKDVPFRESISEKIASSELSFVHSFDDGWRFIRDDAPGAEMSAFDDTRWNILDLPHDWSIDDLPESEYPDAIGPFSKESPGGVATGHVLGGIGWYRKTFTLDKNNEGMNVFVQFDGVYMDSDIWINGHYLGNHPYGYTSFYYDLTNHLNPPGQKNTLVVRVRNIDKNSRWYNGSGIYRHTWLRICNPVHFEQWGAFITTPKVTEKSALVNIDVAVENKTSNDQVVDVLTHIIDLSGEKVGETRNKIVVSKGKNSKINQLLSIDTPQLWSPDSPALYEARIELIGSEKTIDTLAQNFGIRSIQFDAEHGFLLNGKEVFLRGGCMHHDNGPLGSAAIDRAEERRVELMKTHGFNAIRTSHNPPSPAFLDACDRLGMLVIDEAFDCWEHPKNPFDYNKYFDDWWKRDIHSMVRRDRNHPSIILWSIGNEIYERAEPSGLEIAGKLIKEVKSLDDTRPVTEAICGFWDHPGRPWSSTAPAFELLDVGGYNYQWKQYEPDHKTFPKRIMVGTESVPQEAFENWQQVEKHQWVIGDFVWTGMDYLGESGIGHAVLDNQKETFSMPWPWFVSYCGDIDICGFKKPQSYYRDVVWRRSRLELAVHAPLPEGRTEKVSYWGWPDERQSWNWSGFKGQKLKVRVFTRCQSVRLELNGNVVAEKDVSDENRLIAEFEVPYEPGELRAVGIENGKDTISKVLKTTGKAHSIKLTPDRAEISGNKDDLSYVTVEVVDKQGNRIPDANTMVHFSVSGAGKLAAVGNGDPADMMSFHDGKCKVFRGKCLAIIRSGGKPGTIVLRAKASGVKAVKSEIKMV